MLIDEPCIQTDVIDIQAIFMMYEYQRPQTTRSDIIQQITQWYEYYGWICNSRSSLRS